MATLTETVEQHERAAPEPKNMGPQVLVVDDEPVVTEVVERYLRLEGYEVSLASDGAVALQLAQEWAPDLVILDIMLPAVDGLEVCRQIRNESQVPIIVLTARGDETDRVVGLELGADDYVAKPFSPRDLVARVKSVLRRASFGACSGARRHTALRRPQYQPPHALGYAERERADLTGKEFDLLLFLASHAGQVFTREQLMDNAWDYTYAGDSSTVTVHIRRLREKIEVKPVKPRHIKTVWGVGYKFEG